MKAIVGSFEPRRSQSSEEERLKSTVVLAAFQQALWRDEERALAIAAEMAAFCPPEDMLHAGDLKALASGLLGTAPPGPVRGEPWRPDR
ncbi:MAG: hypothetical protein ACLP8S_34060, partial [Solirubrobacteraceae bacterium]